jgi:Uma2 family endonuclease
MTVTDPLVRPEVDQAWTIERLADAGLPEGPRYEIVDGSLLVSPPPNTFHFGTTSRLARRLDRACPDGLIASSAGLGVSIRNGATYYIPDIVVARGSVTKTEALAADPVDVLLVVEVLSPSNASRDRVLKRHDYAEAGIPHYWLVDQKTQTVTVLSLDDTGRRYAESAVLRPGERWTTDEPFPFTLDPAEIF